MSVKQGKGLYRFCYVRRARDCDLAVVGFVSFHEGKGTENE